MTKWISVIFSWALFWRLPNPTKQAFIIAGRMTISINRQLPAFFFWNVLYVELISYEEVPSKKMNININTGFFCKLWNTMLFFSSFCSAPWRYSTRHEFSLYLLVLWIHLKLACCFWEAKSRKIQKEPWASGFILTPELIETRIEEKQA